MADFAVWHDGLPENTARWVMAVSSDNMGVLLVDDDKKFYWKALSECTMGAAHTPQQPTMVVIAGQMPQQNGLVIAEPNRAMRRNGQN